MAFKELKENIMTVNPQISYPYKEIYKKRNKWKF